MDDVFVIGYPMGLSGGGSVLPLYKRGSIATEPLVNHNGLPRLLIDCRTDKGMSGSPVVFRRSGPWSPNGKLDDETHFETVENFLGVYAGRLIDPTANGDAKESDRISEIGVVWKRSALDALVERGVEGTKLEHFPIKQNRRGFPSGANSDSFWWLAEEASPRWPKHCPTTFASV